MFTKSLADHAVVRSPDLSGMGPLREGLAEALLQQIVPSALPMLAHWGKRTIDALPPELADSAVGFRDLVPTEDERAMEWTFPRSNAAEDIEAYVWLSQRLNDQKYLDIAIRHADLMINDPVRGIYQGEQEDGVGQVWYWRDVDVYVTNYTIRVPAAMLKLAEVTGNQKYREIAELAGRQLIRSQRKETGILREGWWPVSPDATPQEEAAKAAWVSPRKINSRCAHVVRGWAELYRATGKTIYLDAIRSFTAGFEKYQNPDGSIPSDIRTDAFEVLNPQRKAHFMIYTLGGMATAACLLPEEKPLRRIAERIGHFLLGRFRQTGHLPYGDINDDGETEEYCFRSATPESTFALTWLSQLTGDPVYREIGCRVALNALLRMLNCPEYPDFHGGIPVWPNSDMRQLPEFNRYHHFWAILGLKALEDTSPQKAKPRGTQP